MANAPKGRIGRVVKPKSVPTAKPASPMGRPRKYEDDNAAKAAKNEANKAAARAQTQEGIAAAGEEAGSIQQSREAGYMPATDMRPAFSEAANETPDVRNAFDPGALEASENFAQQKTERQRRFFSPLTKQNFPKLLDDQLGHVWKMQGYIDELRSRLSSYQSGYRSQDVKFGGVGDQDDSYIDTGEDTRITSKFKKYDIQANGPRRTTQFGDDERRNRAVVVPTAHLNAAQAALDKHIFAHQDGNGGTARLYLGDAADHLMQAYNHIANHATSNNNPDPEVRAHSTAFTSILSDGETNEYKDEINLRPMPSVLTGEVNKYGKRVAGYYNEDAPEEKAYSRGRDTDAVNDQSPSIKSAYFEAGRKEKSGDSLLEEPETTESEEDQMKKANEDSAAAAPLDNKFLYEDSNPSNIDTQRLSDSVTDSTMRANDFLRSKGRGLSNRRKRELAPVVPKTPEQMAEQQRGQQAKAAVLSARADRDNAKEHWLNQPGNTALSYLSSEALRDPSGYMERVRSQSAPVKEAEPKLTKEEHEARQTVYQGHIDNIVSHLRRGKDVPVESAMAVGAEGVAHARSFFAKNRRLQPTFGVSQVELTDPFGEKMGGGPKEDLAPDFNAVANNPEDVAGPGGETPEQKKGRSVSAFIEGRDHEELFGGAR